jgi:hypothetical protein
LDACLFTSDSIIKSNQISYIAKEEILSFCKNISMSFFNDEYLPNTILTISSISENLCSKFGFNLYKNRFLSIIQKKLRYRNIKNLNDLMRIFHQFLQAKNLEQFNIYCNYLESFSLSKFLEKVKSISSENSGRNLTELLTAFENEKIFFIKRRNQSIKIIW